MNLEQMYVYLKRCSAYYKTKNYATSKKKKVKRSKVIDKRDNYPTDKVTSIEPKEIGLFKQW